MIRSPKLLLLGAMALGLAWSCLAPRPHETAPLSTQYTTGTGSATKQREQRKVPRSAPDESSLGETRRPHPITPQHEDLARRREVISAIVSAVEAQEYGRARELLVEAGELEAVAPEGAHFSEAVRGYRLILDCLAARGPLASEPRALPADLMAASRQYLDSQRLPPRRQVRRVCLEGRPFSRRA